MSSRRFDDRIIFVNNHPQYAEIIAGRGQQHIHQYPSPRFRSLTSGDIQALNTQTHVWTIGDKLYKIASEAYGSPKLWWIIAWFNSKPLESDFKLGDVVYIPFPLSTAMELYYSK